MRVVVLAMVLLVGCVGSGDGDDTLCPLTPVDEHQQFFHLGSLDCEQVHTTAICEDPECCMEDEQTSFDGACHGGCFDYDEAACKADSSCFAVGDPEAFYKGTDDFIGCYENPSQDFSDTPCVERTSITDCVARRPNGDRCTPFIVRGSEDTFAGCQSVTDVADACDAPVTCLETAPTCGPGLVPAIVNGCYSGCIEQDWCR